MSPSVRLVQVALLSVALGCGGGGAGADGAGGGAGRDGSGGAGGDGRGAAGRQGSGGAVADGGSVDGPLPDAAQMVCEGNRWAANADEVGAIAGCTVITGNLSVTGNELLSAELPLLTKIDGFLSVWGNPILTRAAFAKLRVVGGKIDISFNPALVSLELPVLETVNESALPAPYDVIISDNALPACEVDPIRAQLAASGFRGTSNISDDGGGCRR